MKLFGRKINVPQAVSVGPDATIAKLDPNADPEDFDLCNLTITVPCLQELYHSVSYFPYSNESSKAVNG